MEWLSGWVTTNTRTRATSKYPWCRLIVYLRHTLSSKGKTRERGKGDGLKARREHAKGINSALQHVPMG
eukprot:14939419-Heterocapsa_arctica.AAC.1